MNRIAFIIPYYGKFNSYFPLWLKSCGYNADVADFFVITDIPYGDIIPKNVKFVFFTWKGLIDRIQSFYDFKIALDTPYGLCDYKCAYGEIFNDLIKDYSHWAYGDNDLIWGKWSDFLPANWYEYDKMGDFGHLTIVKNDDVMNRIYRYREAYKIAFSDSRNLFFDERGFNVIVNKHSKKTFSFKIADCNPRVKKLSPITPLNDIESGLFEWSEGKLSHLSLYDQSIVREDVMYVHFLKRPMSVKRSEVGHEHFLMIYGNTIEVTDSEGCLIERISKCSRNEFYFGYWIKYLSIKQLSKTLKAKLAPVSEKVRKINDIIIRDAF